MNFVDAADIPLEQYEDDNDASGEDTQEDEENNEEPRRKRGKDRSYTLSVMSSALILTATIKSTHKNS